MLIMKICSKKDALQISEFLLVQKKMHCKHQNFYWSRKNALQISDFLLVQKKMQYKYQNVYWSRKKWITNIRISTGP